MFIIKARACPCVRINESCLHAYTRGRGAFIRAVLRGGGAFYEMEAGLHF
jgi:hypothetical protein